MANPYRRRRFTEPDEPFIPPHLSGLLPDEPAHGFGTRVAGELRQVTPGRSSLMPGESAGIPTELWRRLGVPIGGPDYGLSDEQQAAPPLADVQRAIAPTYRYRELPDEEPTFLDDPMAKRRVQLATDIMAQGVAGRGRENIEDYARVNQPWKRPGLTDALAERQRYVNPVAVESQADLPAGPAVRPRQAKLVAPIDPNDPPADRLTRLTETRDYHAGQPATNDDPWWKNLLKGLARGGLAGLGSGQGLAGALGGAATGGVLGLAMPGLDDRYEQGQQLGELDREIGGEYRRQKAMADLEGQRAITAYQRARPAIEQERLGNVERRLDLTEAYNQGRLGESQANRDARLSEGAANRDVRVGEGEANRQVRVGEGTANRESRERLSRERLASTEKVVKWRIASAEKIAAANQAIQRSRVSMSADQFLKRYPGAGRTVTAEALAAKATAMGVLPEHAAAAAVQQGYRIID